MIRYLACLLVPFCFLTPLRAQERNVVKKAPHSLRLLCVEAAATASNLVIAEKTDKGWVPRWRLVVSSQFLTEPLGFQTRKLALAIDPSPPPASSGFNGPATPVATPFAITPFFELNLPDSDAVTAVLVTSADEKKGPYRVILLDTNSARFGEGKVLMQNFTTSTVAGVFGGKSAKTEPGQSVIVQPGSDQPADMAQVTLARQNGPAWEPICDTRWPAKADYRRYLLLIPRADGTIYPFIMPEYPPYR